MPIPAGLCEMVRRIFRLKLKQSLLSLAIGNKYGSCKKRSNSGMYIASDDRFQEICGKLDFGSSGK